MEKTAHEILAYFRKNGGIAKFASIRKAGFHPDILHVLEESGKIEKIARGIYQISKNTLGSHPDLVLASLQAPKGIVCLVSALSFHEATTEIPSAVDLAVPFGSRGYRIQYPPTRLFRFSKQTWECGVENHIINGQKVRIYSLAKTIVDCFKFRSRIGINIVTEALKNAINDRNLKPQEIIRFARICRVERIVKPLLEVLM